MIIFCFKIGISFDKLIYMKNTKNWYNKSTHEHHMSINVNLEKDFGLNALDTKLG